MGLGGASILITGGSGSAGRVLTSHLLKQDPKRLVIYSRGEHLQEDMQREFNGHEALRFFIGDVRDRERLQMAMRDIDIVFHAAALKVVPKCEIDPIEAIHTNIIGAENVVRAAIGAKVQKVVALSTDKAVNPVNCYGATKLAAEKLFLAAHSLGGRGGPLFSVCRYGNICGSRGSVVPLFKRLAAEGHPLPITHTRMTRFFMTLDDAVKLILLCAEETKGAEIYVPKIPSMRIVELAAAIAPEAEQIVTGIRPGEKLHEVLITEDEARLACEYPGRYIISERFRGQSRVPEGWRYSSDSNNHWLSIDMLRSMTADVSNPWDTMWEKPYDFAGTASA